jgi:hypothetical protein
MRCRTVGHGGEPPFSKRDLEFGFHDDVFGSSSAMIPRTK